jgi:hypothetical protein
MSRQNLTQRLKRDNFPEQDMHVFAALLGHRVSIRLEPTVTVTRSEFNRPARKRPFPRRRKRNRFCSRSSSPPFLIRRTPERLSLRLPQNGCRKSTPARNPSLSPHCRN